MSSEGKRRDVGTSADDYDGAYYDCGGLQVGSHGGYVEYSWETDEWRNFFLGIADRIVAVAQPKSFLDVGCARGLLVQALATKGVDAEGVDISAHTVESAHDDVKGRLRVGSATEPHPKKYDMISCIETLEHMDPQSVQLAIDAMTSATDKILFSSTPRDFEEATHINVNPVGQWAAWFAERGFYRRPDVDATFLTPWALYLERAEHTPRSLVHMYEEQLAPMREEVAVKRNALLQAQRDASEGLGGAGLGDRSLDDDVLLRRHADLAARDNVMGLEAQIVNLENQLTEARARVKRLRERAEVAERELVEVRQSRTWRVGRAVTGPLGRLKG